MTGIALALAGALAAFAPAAAAGPRPVCGQFYTIHRGDTLTDLAWQAYNSGDFKPITSANSEILSESAGLVPGTELWIPCPRKGPQTRRAALREGYGKPTAAAPAAAPASRPDPGLSFVTGSDFAPFAHEALPEGGMITELVRLAVKEQAPGKPAAVTFVPDWTTHARLLEKGEFELGFPWYKPDCERADRLAADMRERCEKFDFSAPFYEVWMGYYTRAGDPLAGADSYAALAGRRICRPAGYFTFDLDQLDLREPAVSRIFPPTAEDCFALLERGEADVVTLARNAAQPEISRLGLDGRVAEIAALASSQTLHVVAAKSNPKGKAELEVVNAGLAELKKSGRWFEVVARQLGAFGLGVR